MLCTSLYPPRRYLVRSNPVELRTDQNSTSGWPGSQPPRAGIAGSADDGDIKFRGLNKNRRRHYCVPAVARCNSGQPGRLNF